ncbi:MAG: thiamine pyrophosphate-dependent enzyme [Candidatus Cloacimonetes bacterium]|jgi:2-oxoglutarate ferredoxin oxidoreductase subunit beta|nr:thiamine pyrophosphate-dependent enzyme [Candidatus Cloacimonadota bacterium]MCB5287557.1 thiamine pyrophosphate-dependent enzyme [Candidatus Cloacimonadota bacterium]MCK9185208.1 thiamine pyrophosphate-dependent enzyme [Candidatus Cloacimonadota bacterium]MCK9583967.1 thiamine pyrophosphate-dependent enzyme [Candidatus Cloacimonadota bacterium]MDY0229878.1 thiamine pyrophosphate-dependent enzyme [Candidatus Cloacimonadaceae bacterium]
MRKLISTKENTWCTGCGNFGLFAAVRKSIQMLHEAGTPMADIVMSAGIGCHGKIFDYLEISGIYGLHGRALATASGVKLANPQLKVLVFGGDGDSLGEGLEHTLFAAKRNMDITLILHNNGNYGLTTGQASPLSIKGFKGLTTPMGNVERPFTPVTLMMEAGASFVGRSYTARIEHLSQMIFQAVNHPGFSFVEVLQPCVSYNNTYQLYNEHCQIMSEIPESEEKARSLAKSADPIYLGIYHQEEIPVYHQQIQDGGASLTRAQRLALLKS